MIPKRFEIADGPAVLNSVLIDVDERTGKARSIERVDRTFERGSGSAGPSEPR